LRIVAVRVGVAGIALEGEEDRQSTAHQSGNRMWSGAGVGCCKAFCLGSVAARKASKMLTQITQIEDQVTDLHRKKVKKKAFSVLICGLIFCLHNLC